MSVAGLLVTNHRGIPVEFRYTDPVQVTETQRLLHRGDQLADVLTQAIGQSLWSALEQKPRLLLVEDKRFAGIWEHTPQREQVITACVEIAPNDAYQLPQRHGTVTLPVEVGARRQLRAQVFPEDADVLAGVERVLTHASEKMRLDEPFERIESILQAIYKLPPHETRKRIIPDESFAPMERLKSSFERPKAEPFQPELVKVAKAPTPSPRVEEMIRRERILQSDIKPFKPSFEREAGDRSPDQSEPIAPQRREATTPARTPQASRAETASRRTPTALSRTRSETPLVEDADFTREAIAERLRRSGVRTEAYQERAQRLRTVHEQTDTPTPNVEPRLPERPARPMRRAPNEDEEPEMVTPVRSAAEVARWKQRLSTWKTTGDEDEEEALDSPSDDARSATMNPPSANSLRSRPDLQWMFRKNGER
jgi:hypothetical protein